MRSRAVAAAIWIARAVGRLPGVDGVEVSVTVDLPRHPTASEGTRAPEIRLHPGRFYDRGHTGDEGIHGKLLSERRRTSSGLTPMEHPRRGR